MTERRRASAGQQAGRINAAADLLADGVETAEAARRLARRFRVSQRQARRYVDAARERGEVAVPDPTVVFTVRLPVGLVRKLRRHARTSRRTLSSLVAEAVERGWSRRGGAGAMSETASGGTLRVRVRPARRGRVVAGESHLGV